MYINSFVFGCWRRMKVLFLCLLLGMLFVTASANPLKKSQNMHGALHHSGPPIEPKFGTSFSFQEEIKLDLEIDGRLNGSRLVIRQHLSDTQPVGRKIAGAAIYMSKERDIIYREDVEVDGSVTTYGLVRNNGVLEYFNGRGGMLVLPVSAGAITRGAPRADFVPRANTTKRTNTKPRRKRQSLEALGMPAVAKCIVFVDKTTFEKFNPLNANSQSETIADIRNFFTLAGNEMTILYQSLRQYGNVFFRGTSTSYPQNIAVQILDVIFPEFPDDFGFVAANVQGNILLSDDILNSFTTFVKTYTPTGGVASYDHAALVVGYDLLKQDDNSKLDGYAWDGTMCSKSSFLLGRHTSVNKFNAELVPTMAHEMGHGFGMSHDGQIPNTCEDATFLMAASGFRGTVDNAATFRTFSQCSSTDLQAYFNSLNDDFRETCLMPPTAAFNTNFCLGFPGQKKTLDQQCQLVFGASSTRCTMTDMQDPLTESFLQSGYVADCVVNDKKNAPFYCKKPNTDECEAIDDVLMGTRCALDGVLNPNNRCIKGVCKSTTCSCPSNALCEDNEDQDFTVTPVPTLAPTTISTRAPITTLFAGQCVCYTTACCREKCRSGNFVAASVCAGCKYYPHPTGGPDCIISL